MINTLKNINLFLTSSIIFVFFLSFNLLPREMPVFLTRGFEPAQVAAKPWLVILPVFALLMYLTNLSISKKLESKKQDVAALYTQGVSTLSLGFLLFSIVSLVTRFPLESTLLDRFTNLSPPTLSALILSLALTLITAKGAKKLKLFDTPHGPYPKVRPIPRLGGIPLFLTFAAVSLIFFPSGKHLTALLLGGLIITILQIADDIRPLPFYVQGAGHVLAALIIVAGGIGIDFIRNPIAPVLGEQFIRLDIWEIPIALRGVTYHLTFPSDIFTVFWILGFIYIVDWLDGLDGLAAGIGSITALVLVLLSFKAGAPLTALLASILFGSLLGFLYFNFYPAKIYLGGGAFLLGFILGTLAIFEGVGKTGTSLLVLAVPVIDATIVIFNRLKRKQLIFLGDKTHLHHRLIEKGMSHTQTVFFEWGIVGVLGLAALLLEGFYKFLAILIVFVSAVLLNRRFLD